MVNRVFLVEDFVYRVERENYSPSEDEVRYIGEILGQPSRKLNVVLDRYWQVFTRYIERRCSIVDSRAICIYSWRYNTPFKIFPLALHAFGTVILLENQKPVKVLAYPFNKPLSYMKTPGVSRGECGDKIPREVSVRIDGWHLTAYYNPLVDKWVFATRYALHNMYYKKGRLVEDSIDNIVNPYVSIADAIARETGLYEKLDKYRDWTFTFTLEGPEPAVTKPPYPIGIEVEKYRLYTLLARDPGGRLYTWSETRRLIDFDSPRSVDPDVVDRLYEDIRSRLDVRSYFAFIDTDDPENPLIVELESDYYADAMNTKYLLDAKSAIVLISENRGPQLAEILEEPLSSRIRAMDILYNNMVSVVNENVEKGLIDRVSRLIVDFTRRHGGRGIHYDEIKRNLSEGNVKRVVKKTLAILLEGISLVSNEPLELIEKLYRYLKETEELNP